MTLQIQKVPIKEVMQFYVDQYMLPDDMEIDEHFLDALTADLVVVFKEKSDE